MDARADERLCLGLFAASLAAALLLHQLWWDGFELTGPHVVVAGAAVAVLLRPVAVARLLVLLAAEVVAVARDMPGVGSHTLLAAVCCAAILAFVALEALRGRGVPDAGALWARVVPLLRWAVVVLYAAAALAKLNAGWFDPAVSCGAAMASHVAWWDPALLDAGWLRTAAIYGSVAIEASLPVLLLVRRTRVAGLVLGVGFHLVLALAGNVPFTSLVLALYVAWLEPGAVGRAWARRPPGLHGARHAAGAAATATAVAWTLGAWAERADPAATRTAVADGTRLVVVLWVAGLVLAAARAARTRPATARPSARGLRLGHPAFALAIAVLVLDAATPYVGLKTETSFAMFSNLQTEGGDWNHLLVPQAVRVFAAQDHLVTVTASNDPSLLRRTRGGTRMVRFEVERHLRAHPGAWATVSPGALDPHGPPLAPVVDRVAKFRDVRAAARRGC